MTTTKKFAAASSFFAVLLFSTTFGQDVTKVGTTAAKFLSIPIGPRAIALGNSYASIADEATSLYWNPAGITKIMGSDFHFSHTQWIAELRHTFTGVVVSDPDMGSFGISVIAMTMPEMEVTTEQFPEGTGEQFSANSYAFGLSYAKTLTEWFSIGITGKYVQEGIYNSKATALAVDIGTLFTTPFYGIRLGVAISNFGNKMQMTGSDLLVQKDIDETQHGNNASIDAYLGTDKFDLPLNLRISLSGEVFKTEEQRLTFAVDASHPNDNVESVSVGAEYSLFNDLISLRGGRHFLTDFEQKYAFGGGMKYPISPSIIVRIDYAYASMGRLQNVQTYSLGIQF
ncbi:MAG: PorV/PorQ family protein [Bacteroidota bacterium]